jgi:DNA-binding transcriptional MerR regulator
LSKGPEAFRTISEAAEELGVPQHVLRFWETRFSFIRPMKRAGGRRFYRPQDLMVLRGVRRLLHDEGYTIKGVQKLHREQGTRRLLEAAESTAPVANASIGSLFGDDTPVLGAKGRSRLSAALDDLLSAKAHLDGLLQPR